MLFEQDSNDAENYVNVSSYNNQHLTESAENPFRSFYRKSKSIPLKQIQLFGNLDFDHGFNNGLTYNIDTQINNSNFSTTSPNYIHQLRQQQNLNYNKYQQATLGLSNSTYFNGPLQYQQLARGLRINSANNYMNERDNNSISRTGESSYRSNPSLKYAPLPNKGQFYGYLFN